MVQEARSRKGFTLFLRGRRQEKMTIILTTTKSRRNGPTAKDQRADPLRGRKAHANAQGEPQVCLRYALWAPNIAIFVGGKAHWATCHRRDVQVWRQLHLPEAQGGRTSRRARQLAKCIGIPPILPARKLSRPLFQVNASEFSYDREYFAVSVTENSRKTCP